MNLSACHGYVQQIIDGLGIAGALSIVFFNADLGVYTNAVMAKGVGVNGVANVWRKPEEWRLRPIT